MRFARGSPSRADRGMLGALGALGLAFFVGLLVAFLGPLLSVGFLVGLLTVGAMLRWPQVGFALAAALAIQAIPGSLAPDIPFGFFRLKLYEAAFLCAIAGTWIRHFGALRSTRSGSRPEARTQWMHGATLLLLVAFSAAVSRFFLGNSDLVLAEARPFLALLTLALVTQLIDDGLAVERVDQVLFVSGVMLSIIVIVQLSTGWRILDARVEDLGLSANTGITRSITDAGILVQAYAIYRFAQFATNATLRPALRMLAVLVLLVTVVGLLGTFTRGAWIATAAGALVAAFVHKGWPGLFKVTVAGFVVLALAIAMTFVVRPKVADAMVDRMLSVSDELGHGASFGWRKQENGIALGVLAARPVLGVGLGGAYKSGVMDPGSFLNDQYFIHNGYLYFPLKMGVIGAGLLATLIVLMLKSLLASRQTTDRRMAAAAVGVYVVALLSAVTGPVFSKFVALVVLLSLIALNRAKALRPAPAADGSTA